MDYVDPATARDLPGLRLALTVGFPAPYCMSAKAILAHHGVDYVPVAQLGGQPNAELKAWTGHRNAPVAVYEDEAPRTGWLEILQLAERLGSGPSLIPNDINLRSRMIGLTHELIGEGGWIWQMRLLMLGLGGPERAAAEAKTNPMYADYGYSEAARAEALSKARVILDWFTAHVRAQADAGSRYLIGDGFTAADIYWAYFSQALRTVPEERSPMPAPLRKAYDAGGEQLAPYDALLLEQRDFIFDRHLSLPMDF